MKPFILIDRYEKESLKPITHLVLSIYTPNLDTYCDQLIADGFKDPVITTKVYNTIFNEPKLVFTWDGTPTDKPYLQKKMIELSMKNVLRNVKINKKSCDIKIQFTEKAINFLYTQTRFIKQYKFGDTQEQREISGKFTFISLNGNTYNVDVDEKSIRKGDKESASYVDSFGTFHTHPYDAYEKHNVCIAWPSADDYLAFLYMYGLCLSGFHVVSTLEGIYLISLKKYISPQKVLTKYFKNKKTKENIEYQHGEDYPETDKYCNIENGKINMKKIKKYVRKINNMGKFNLVFATWEECKNPIRLLYAPLNETCLLSTNQSKILKELKK